jgi:hypothetical protein
MQSRDCSFCGKPAEPPLTIGRSGQPDELASLADSLGLRVESQDLPVEPEFVFCLDCLDRLHEEEAAFKEIDEGMQAGTICHLCFEELNPPDETTTWSFEGRRPLRLCSKCKDKVKRCRQQRGQQ